MENQDLQARESRWQKEDEKKPRYESKKMVSIQAQKNWKIRVTF